MLRNVCLVCTLLYAVAVQGQAVPTASRALQLSGFAGISGVYTGLSSAKNLSVTAGVDLGVGRYFGLDTDGEVRGMVPIAEGSVDHQRNILAGLKFAKTYASVSPYANILFGRGEIFYNGYQPNPERTFGYSRTTSNIWSPGIGVDISLSNRLAVKLDAQLQRYSTPVTESGHLYAKPLTFGFVYHLFRR